MRNRVYETVRCPFVCPSVCLSQNAAGLLLWARRQEIATAAACSERMRAVQ